MRTLLTIVVLLSIGASIAHFGLGWLPVRDGEPPRRHHWRPFDIPAESEFMFHEPLGDELGQSMLFHNLSGMIDHAREADVIFIGNSRLNLGLRGDQIVPLAEAAGIKVFSLGCGHGEMHTLPMEVIRKHDLRPKIVVFTGGPNFYYEFTSPVAKEAMSISRWNAMKKRFESTSSFYLTYYLHQVLPRLDVFNKRLYPAWLSYRSARTGFTKVIREPGGAYPVKVLANSKEKQHLVNTAKRLNEELAARGTLMFATQVPFVRTETWHLPRFQEEAGIPYVSPSFEGITSNDASHLNAASANVYSQRFWEAFIQHPEVRTKLNLDHE